MSRPIMAGEACGGADPVREVLRDTYLLLGAIGASLTLVTLLSLLLPDHTQPQRAATPVEPVAEHQIVARQTPRLTPWRNAAQQ
ncbi:MAG: hypothetical protein ACHQIO_19990 [Nevskiales bacterium]